MANGLTRWDPFRETLSLRDAIDRLFEDSFISPRSFVYRDTASSMNPLPIDLYETEGEIVLKAAVPGAKSEDLNIQFQDGRLIIDVNIASHKLENATLHYRELGYGQYHREIGLPMPVQTDKVDATLNDGLLTLRVPKAEELKPKKIQVKVENK